MSRVSTVVHRDRRIVVIDFTGCKPGGYAAVIAEAEAILRKEPPGSVRAMTIVENLSFDTSTANEMRQFVISTQPHLKANAVVGVTGLKKVVWMGVRPFYEVPAEAFVEREAALDWLASC